MTTYQTIIANIQAGISQLNSKSVAALFSKLAEAIAQVIDTVLAEIINTQTIITQIVSEQNYGHSKYYTNAALAYQDGDDLSVDANGNYYYALIDTNKQIITQAAFEETISGTSSTLALKVATIDSTTGLLIALDSTQLDNFISYMSNFEIPGLPLLIVSSDGNILAFDAKIIYNKTFNLSNLQSNVQAAILQFQKLYPFNGIFHNYDFESYLVANVPGVTSVFLSNTTIDGNAFAGETSLLSGYFNYGTLNITYGTV
jgi:hypothetical protein